MKIYACPKELPAPTPDYKNFDIEKMAADEEAHKAALKAHLIKQGYKGSHTGEIYSTPVADGQALYMVVDGPKQFGLIHLAYGDGYAAPDVQYLPKTEILKRIKSSKELAALFESKRAKA